MGCRVLFIAPAKTAALSENGSPVQKLRTNMSLPAATVLGALETHGFDVHFLDLTAEGWNERRYFGKNVLIYGLSDKAAIERVGALQPDYVLVTSMFSFEQALVDSLVRSIKAAFPHLCVIIGGIHASVRPEWHFEESSPDFIVIGEGEETAVELLTELGRPDPHPEKVAGIAFRNSQGKITRTPVRAKLADLGGSWAFDKVLIKPDGQARYLERYTRKSPAYAAEHLGENVPTFAFYGSRGCPFHCAYCASTPRDGATIRHRGSDRIYQDFLTARQTYGAAVFYNQADTFGFHRGDREFLEMVRDYRRRSGDMGFVMNNPNAFFARVFFTRGEKCELDERFIRLLAESGLNCATLAIETTIQRFNRKIDFRRITQDHLIELCKALRSYGIRTDTYMIYGFPGETEEEFRHDIEFAEYLCAWVDSVSWHFLTLLPGTGYYDQAIARGKFTEQDYRTAVRNGYSYFYPTNRFNLSQIPTAELKEAVTSFGQAWV